ncbi:hypothetical protein [Croceicoccus sp. Ery5]|uniref:hypothetical protein n=1 Tax=Croceicoccus sp. Ery5 TaxID=1703340 RepID=UPI001E3792E8|nr:hypothetical protein [Croceicoccus sp. Ery5]
MSREVDIIDARHPRTSYITQDEAWRDLRGLVLAETGVDLERSHNFAIRIVPVKHSTMAAIICAPHSAPTAEIMAENSFVSFFGNIGPVMAEAAREMARSGYHPGFCRRISDQREAIHCPGALH